MSNDLIPTEIIENKIFFIRNQKVMIDRDLADLYGVETKRLNEAVKRNIERFPEEFMFQLNDNEKNELVANCDRLKKIKFSTTNPYAFNEHGVAMLSSVLKSKQAIAVNIQIIKTFVKLKEMALTNKEISQRIDELEHRFMTYAKDTSADINKIFRQLFQLSSDAKEYKAIGFQIEDK
jgi:2,3-bisphosphoglycerate-independent phosphoglycerate mutase